MDSDEGQEKSGYDVWNWAYTCKHCEIDATPGKSWEWHLDLFPECKLKEAHSQ